MNHPATPELTDFVKSPGLRKLSDLLTLRQQLNLPLRQSVEYLNTPYPSRAKLVAELDERIHRHSLSIQVRQ